MLEPVYGKSVPEETLDSCCPCACDTGVGRGKAVFGPCGSAASEIGRHVFVVAQQENTERKSAHLEHSRETRSDGGDLHNLYVCTHEGKLRLSSARKQCLSSQHVAIQAHTDCNIT
jgi:hypothetical protein